MWIKISSNAAEKKLFHNRMVQERYPVQKKSKELKRIYSTMFDANKVSSQMENVWLCADFSAKVLLVKTFSLLT